MAHQWEKGLYEVVTGPGGVAVNNIPVVDTRGIDPFAVFFYLSIMREALAVTSRRVVEKISRYTISYAPEARKMIDPYLKPMYQQVFSKGMIMMKDVRGNLEKKVNSFFKI